ncbi:uncharacterized protein LOC120355009 isoform X2 [Nilaparvata lugens]|nr:uncharacterized protein LOC120355009 isoform X2 [Nilaparvata lugens]
MKRKSADANRVILDFLKEMYPIVNPRLVISDYEAGIKVAMKEVFPNVTRPQRMLVSLLVDLDEQANVPVANEVRDRDDQEGSGRQRRRVERQGGPRGGENLDQDAALLVVVVSPYKNYKVVPTVQQPNDFMNL